MEKIVNPCKCKLYDIRGEIIESPAFVKIEYKEKKPGEKVLSMEVADNVLMRLAAAFRLTAGMSI